MPSSRVCSELADRLDTPDLRLDMRAIGASSLGVGPRPAIGSSPPASRWRKPSIQSISGSSSSTWRI